MKVKPCERERDLKCIGCGVGDKESEDEPPTRVNNIFPTTKLLLCGLLMVMVVMMVMVMVMWAAQLLLLM